MNWYESSIKSLVEEFFRKNGFEVTFDPSLPWEVCMQKCRENILPSQRIRFNQIAKMARTNAFDSKYGTYSYITDYRSVCENWNSIILKEIQKAIGNTLIGKKVLAVGANNGSELAIIFEKDFNKMSFDVVEISQTACSIGANIYPSINFYCSSMDEINMPENEYDIFISLRAAYCAGNNLDVVVQKAVKNVKPSGVIIFSISNGYIDTTNGKFIPKKGVYNPENLHCDENETEKNINWVKTAMLSNGCSEVRLVDAESEILLISTV